MFYHSSKLQYEVKVDKPDPVFAKFLQQAIGGVEGEIRVAMQYLFQAMGARGEPRFRDMLMMTATEEFSHVEFLGHAVALESERCAARRAGRRSLRRYRRCCHERARPQKDDGGYGPAPSVVVRLVGDAGQLQWRPTST